ncbi:preprotein translocase subunit SecD [Halosimplex pelagicum]|uniref:Protein-export membrane protein SecD n=1 Tax=Halosimplex pelagicum TaxID=869886 RepID=A0A7D5TB78_9EURY|nr:preprotein translocase subunit SecD [Halosimplex pelagicum]QLH81055.1 preprotein translocase subunit SecD [Halosimplex pelagicum]
MNLRENWRIVMLVVFVLASTFALFGPAGAPDAGANNSSSYGAATGPTNLQFGLELAGGSRIRAPLVGTTAENLEIEQGQRSSIRQTVGNQLNVSTGDVSVVLNTGNGDAVEVLVENVSEQRFRTALTEAGLDGDEATIRNGVTAQTRQQTVETITAKINRGGLSGGQVATQRSATGENYVVVDVPNANTTEVLNLIGDEGAVTIVATRPVDTDNGTVYRNQTVLTNRQLENSQIGLADVTEGGQPIVPITLTEDAAQNYSRDLVDLGFTSSEATGPQSCRYRQSPDDPGYCLYTTVDGEIVYAAGLDPGLAEDIESGEFVTAPSFVMQTRSTDEAQRLQVNLRAGALPTRLAVENGTVLFLQQSLGDRFKWQALLTGLIAWLAVSGSVFLRYRDPRVALPMLATAAAEVYLLLGFAAAIGLPLNLSYIAGFIAVIGTGVDDLLIIADEILDEGQVATGRVFQSRFRKAFWVIGAAAVTTIIAMSPLAFLSLGDLQGFAIVTIVGVLIGVLVTRPAYGDVLRNLMLDQGGD